MDFMQSRQARSVLVGASAAVGIYYIHQRYTAHKHAQRQYFADTDKTPHVSDPNKPKKVAVDKEFIRRLKTLLAIVMPSYQSKEFALLCMHTSFLVSRTMLSIYVAKLDGSIVKSIVDRDFKVWVSHMIRWVCIAVPATYVNSMILFLEAKLSIAFRTRLSTYLYKSYMTGDTYYRVINLDNRLTNPDQCLTDDVNEWCSELAHLYSHLSKPMLDVVLMATQLFMLSSQRGGGVSLGPTLGGIAMCIGTGFILKRATPPFGRLIAEQARRYGDLRAAHSRVIQSSEEIAFYSGEKLEYHILQDSYDHLIKHINYIYKTRISYTMLEQFLMRYIWSAIGLSMIALPAFSRDAHKKQRIDVVATPTGEITEKQASINPAALDSDDTVSGRTQDFVTARGLLLNAADAIERMMSSWKEVAELAGRTARIYDMLEVFDDVKKGVYKKTQATTADEVIQITDDGVMDDINHSSARSLQHQEDSNSRGMDGMKRAVSNVTLHREVSANRLQHDDSDGASPSDKHKKIRKKVRFGTGEVIDGCDYIDCIDVPIVTPNGDVLIESLTFKMTRDQHLLISGPNGCGKSSLFRLLGGLWPIQAGVLHKPAKKDIFYIPQKPYLTKGNLREQFIYPYTEQDYLDAGFDDSELDSVLDIVALKNVVSREGGLDSVADWRDVLSGGEKQRVAMARLFIHKPKFAILDECTSAVSIDVEGQMYTAAKKHGITLMTVTHRPTLWKYHTHLLQFDGQGGYKFSELDSGSRLTLKEEKSKLEEQLGNITATQKRLSELVHILGEDSLYVGKDLSVSKK